MQPYPPEIEQEMQKFYGTLSEKDQRRYAAVEALKLGHGGIVYIAGVLGCDRNRVSEGIKELKELPAASSDDKRIRKPGGGRKPYHEQHPDIDEKFLHVMADYTAGDPMDEQILWTHLSPPEIAQHLADEQGIQVSETVIRQLLSKHGYRRRQMQKKQR
jgi:hypothetical protein